jgi:hypothetical protein
MPIEAMWVQEPVVRRHLYSGKVTVSDMETVLTDELARLNATDHKLFYIVEFANVEAFPVNLMAVPTALEFVRHPQSGTIAVVQSTSVMGFWLTVFSKVSANKVIKADNADIAYQQLEKLINKEKQV